MKRSTAAPASKARPARPTPIGEADFLGRFTEKDRGSLERQIVAYEQKNGSAPADRWRRLARVLMALAPFPAKLTATCKLQFFIPDGKYRMQVFAIQPLADGAMGVYAPDVVARAIEAGIIIAVPDNPNVYRVGGSQLEMLTIDRLDGNTPEPDPVFKGMTGWNRKAIRMTLTRTASAEQAQAVEMICALAAMDWAGVTATTAS